MIIVTCFLVRFLLAGIGLNWIEAYLLNGYRGEPRVPTRWGKQTLLSGVLPCIIFGVWFMQFRIFR